MNLQDLRIKLDEFGIRSDSYSINESNKDEALILEFMGDEKWSIYYSERGLRTGEELYFSEDEVCRRFLEKALRDPLMRRVK